MVIIMIIGSTERSSTFRDWLSDAIVSILFLKQVNRIVYDKIDKSLWNTDTFCGKIRTRITPNTNTLYAMVIIAIIYQI